MLPETCTPVILTNARREGGSKWNKKLGQEKKQNTQLDRGSGLRAFLGLCPPCNLEF